MATDLARDRDSIKPGDLPLSFDPGGMTRREVLYQGANPLAKLKRAGECRLSVQTNGILLSDTFLDLCVRTKTNIAVSLDGPRHIHDQHRVDHSGQGTFDRTVGLEGVPDGRIARNQRRELNNGTRPW